MLALIQRSPLQILDVSLNERMNVNIPDTWQAQGATLGWETPDHAYVIVNVVPFVVPAGKVTTGLPWYTVDEAEIVTQTCDVIDAPAPTKTTETYGLIRFSVVASAITDSTIYFLGIISVLRVSIGRYRIYYADQDPLRALVPSITLLDPAVRISRLSARTIAYCEIRVTDGAGVAADAAEVSLQLDRIITQ